MEISIKYIWIGLKKEGWSVWLMKPEKKRHRRTVSWMYLLWEKLLLKIWMSRIEIHWKNRKSLCLQLLKKYNFPSSAFPSKTSPFFFLSSLKKITKRQQRFQASLFHITQACLGIMSLIQSFCWEKDRFRVTKSLRRWVSLC